jgi:hypothetical protein
LLRLNVVARFGRPGCRLGSDDDFHSDRILADARPHFRFSPKDSKKRDVADERAAEKERKTKARFIV